MVFVHNDWKTSRPKFRAPMAEGESESDRLGEIDSCLGRLGWRFANRSRLCSGPISSLGNMWKFMVPFWGAKRYDQIWGLKLKLAQHFNVCFFTRCWLQEVLNALLGSCIIGAKILHQPGLVQRLRTFWPVPWLQGRAEKGWLSRKRRWIWVMGHRLLSFPCEKLIEIGESRHWNIHKHNFFGAFFVHSKNGKDNEDLSILVDSGRFFLTQPLGDSWMLSHLLGVYISITASWRSELEWHFFLGTILEHRIDAHIYIYIYGLFKNLAFF